MKKNRQKSKEKVQKNPGQKKAGPEAPANPFKKPIQNSKQQPQKWGGRFSARPIFGASAACGASVVVLNFVSVFCKGLQELLAQLFLAWICLDFFLRLFFDFFFHRKSVFLVNGSSKKRFFGQRIIEKTIFCQESFFQKGL